MKQKTKFKQTEIGMIPEDWDISNLSEATDILTGFPFKGEKYSDKGIKVLRGENVSIGFLRWDTEKRWNHSLEDLDKYYLSDSDIVIGMDGSRVGQNRARIKSSDLPLLLAQRVARLRAKLLLDQRYLYYVIFSDKFFNHVESVRTGTSVPHISSKQIGELKLAVPPLPEQQRIAKILSDLDSKIELNQQMNNTLEEIGKAIFRHWFVDFEFPNEEGKPYRSSGGEIVYNEELGKEIPKGWTVENIDNVCTLITDGSHFSPKEAQDGARRIATIKNMGDFGIDYESCKRISEEDFLTLIKNGCKVEKGDVLISKDGTMGKTLFYDSNEDLVLLSSVAILRVNEVVSPYYLRYYLADKNTQETLKDGYMSGSVLTRIVLKDLKQLRILIPSKRLIEEFSRISSTLQSSISKNVEQNRTIVGLRDLLLPKLMSGKIRVPIEVK